MTKLKIGAIEDEKPVTLTVKLPARVHRDLIAYAEILTREGGHPALLIAPMLTRFMGTDRAFKQARGQIRCKN